MNSLTLSKKLKSLVDAHQTLLWKESPQLADLLYFTIGYLEGTAMINDAAYVDGYNHGSATDGECYALIQEARESGRCEGYEDGCKSGKMIEKQRIGNIDLNKNIPPELTVYPEGPFYMKDLHPDIFKEK